MNNRGLLENAIGDFCEAIHLNPSKYNYYNNRGIAYSKLKMYHAAV